MISRTRPALRSSCWMGVSWSFIFARVCFGRLFSYSGLLFLGFGLKALSTRLWALGSGLWALGFGLWGLGLTCDLGAETFLVSCFKFGVVCLSGILGFQNRLTGR